MTRRAVLAIAAHPDDIEFMMGGTLVLLGRAGFELHLMNIADGSCGSMTEPAPAIAARRFEEAQASARLFGATLHPPIASDLEVFYEETLLRKVAATVREVAPEILLVQSPVDYMEDHMNASRLGVTAAFARGFPNFITVPPRPPIAADITLYHALPWGLRGPLRERVDAHSYVDIGAALEVKRTALECHASQKEWLDRTQGLGSYGQSMEEMALEVGRRSGRFDFAEGWRRHSHLGFCADGADPLREALGERVVHTMEERD